MKYSVGRERIDTIPKRVVVEELRRVAKHYDYRRFSRHEFDAIATACKGSTVISKFDSWDNALNAIGVTLKQHKANRKQISDKDLLVELGRIWFSKGHRPSKAEWEASDAKYSYTTYKSRFDGWLNACAKFIEFVSGGLPEEETESRDDTIDKIVPVRPISPEKIRYVPLKLRLKCSRETISNVFFVARAQSLIRIPRFILIISRLLQKEARLNSTIFRHSVKNAIGAKGMRILRMLEANTYKARQRPVLVS
jgi:hypothetical protein